MPVDPPPPAKAKTPPAPAEPTGRRHAAGADPDKRGQILDGAIPVFSEKGFDAASMNDICRSAGVSKGTLYVYFENKEDLFDAVVARERERLFVGIEKLLEGDLTLSEKLCRYGSRLAEIVCSEKVIRVQRTIIGTAERMPERGARFYEAGAQRAHEGLRLIFEEEIAAGRLVIDDMPLAVHQFAELIAAGLWRPRLFGKARTVPTTAEIDRTVTGAVRMFLAVYGTGSP